ncbi:Ig-like domain repeat protein [Kitasatospora sp. NPDC047058]|uniref:Ig-like domain repeat protein n=1 Tax=Kitasatospora sp. NPDC047058 TaxID=3155620 RepID=UPI0033CA2AB4
MPEKLMWTALPHGLVGAGDTRRLRLSVLVSPRLTTVDGADGELSAFPDLRHWTAVVAATEFALELDGMVVADGLRPLNTLEPTLWEALFTDRTRVRSHVPSDYSAHRLVSYPFQQVRDQVRALYGRVAAEFPLGLPPLRVRDRSGEHVFHPLADALRDQGFGPGDPTEPPPVVDPTQPPPPGLHVHAFAPADGRESASEAVAAFQRFHERPERPDTPLPKEAELAQLLDFHQALSCLSDYPELLTLLGLVLDLEVPTAAVRPESDPRRLRVLPRWKPADQASPEPDISPATSSVWDGTDFTAAGSTAPGRQGLLDLDGSRFDLSDVDVDGAVHKIVNLGLSLDAIANRKAADQPTGAGLPVLRSAGFALVRDARAKAVAEELARAKAHNDLLAASGVPVLEAEQLMRGYRVDVWDSRSGEWHSLCRRIGTYRFEATGAERTLEDEGFVQLSAAGMPAGPGGPDQPAELYLHESMLRWNGWSLVAPRPGRAISREEAGPGGAPESPASAAVTAFGLRTGFAPAGGSLPSLRFGVGYRLRARVVDLAGNSRSLAEAGNTSALPADPPGRTYLRYEAVPSPVVVLRGALDGERDPGESLDRMVVRSANTGLDEDRTPTGRTAERHIAPPRTTEALAEAHGAFDDESGRLRGDRATYRMIRERDGAQLGQEREVPVAPEEQLVLPWLPDPLARGAALRALPGAPEGMVGAADGEGRLSYHAMEVPQPGSVTHLDFGAASEWPAMRPFRLVLREGSGLPGWDARSRVLTVELPKGEVAEIPLSCFFHRADLDLLGVWDWIRREVDAMAAEAAAPADLASLGEQVMLLTQLALEGGHWALTPARTLTLVHAVQQPLGTPTVQELVAERDFGAAQARLLGAVQVHPSSTGRIDLVARWNELPGPAEDPVARRQVEDAAAELRLHYGRVPGGIEFGGETVADYDPVTGRVTMDHLHHPAHQFADTKHRVVRYRAVTTSRFSEYFVRHAEVTLHGTAPTVLDPAGVGLRSETVRSADGAAAFVRAESDGGGDYVMDWQAGTIARSTGSAIPDGRPVQVEFLPPVNRDSPETVVHVPSSARPAAPRVLYVVPAFEWRRQTGSNLMASHRRGHWLRVYLEGPWFSSGEGEQLGVLVARGVAEPVGAIARYVTRSGRDVLRGGGLPPDAHFPRGEADFGDLTLDELPPTSDNRVNVYGHDVAFDADRGLWYCDIEVDLVSSAVDGKGPAFEPFVRLALARYQPHSVVAPDPAAPGTSLDVKLSRVVLADYVQLHADRSVLVTYDPQRPARLRVAVSGDSYERTMEDVGPSRIEISVQEREPGLQGELAWTPVKGGTVTPDTSGGPAPGAVLWRGEVLLPEGRAAGGFRLVVEEHDTLRADDPDQPPRLLYADTLDLAEIGSVTSASSTMLASSPNPSAVGTAVTITATVSGSGAEKPTGVVTFTATGAGAGSRTLGHASLITGTASISVTDLPAGTHVITGSYSGDFSFALSSGVVAHHVNQVEERPDIMELARQFLAQSSKLADQGQAAQAVAAARSAVDILHETQAPPEAKAEYLGLLAEALHEVVKRLMQAGRGGEVAQPAAEAVQVYRQAASISTGESVMKFAGDLLTLSQWLADAALPAQAVTSAQTAVDVLHETQAPPEHEAQYLSLLAEGLHILAQRSSFSVPRTHGDPLKTLLNAFRFMGEPVLEGCLAGTTIMQMNDTGIAVRKVQVSLISLGFNIPAGATGFFGSQTQKAVEDYQAARSLAVDGQIGPNTMAALDSDFVNELRPFPAWLSTSVGLGVRADGNSVKVYVGGDEAFPDIAAAFRSVGSGDFIYIAGWFLDLDCPLDVQADGTGDPATTPKSLLQLASDNGADVRALLAKNPAGGSGGPFGFFNNAAAVSFINGLTNGAAIEDGRVLDAGTHHQKVVVVFAGGTLLSFAGGMDLNRDRVSWGNPPALPLHDVHCRFAGPVAENLYRNFIRRWTDSPVASALASVNSSVGVSGPVGDIQCQSAWTFGNGTAHSGSFGTGSGYTFAPTGERSAKSVILTAIASAAQFIYLEEQYLVDMDISAALQAALPSISSLIILTEDTDTVNNETPGIGQYWARRKNFLSPLLAAGPGKVIACTHAQRYVHSKTWIFDDEFAVVGSANVNRRGMTHDSEQAVGLFEPVYGFLVKDLRIRLWSLHLNRPASALTNAFPALQLWFGSLSAANVVKFDPSSGTDPSPLSEPAWNTILDPDGT